MSDDASFQIASAIWCKAFASVIGIVRQMASAMEEGKLPATCGVCALNFAADTLEGINQRQIETHAHGPDAAMAMLEAKGNA